MSPPEWLSPLAAAEWIRVAAVLAANGETRDMLLLERHAMAYAAWRDAEAEMARTGRVIVMRDDKGNVRSVSASPWVTIADKARAELVETSRLLGLR